MASKSRPDSRVKPKPAAESSPKNQPKAKRGPRVDLEELRESLLSDIRMMAGNFGIENIELGHPMPGRNYLADAIRILFSHRPDGETVAEASLIMHDVHERAVLEAGAAIHDLVMRRHVLGIKSN